MKTVFRFSILWVLIIVLVFILGIIGEMVGHLPIVFNWCPSGLSCHGGYTPHYGPLVSSYISILITIVVALLLYIKVIVNPLKISLATKLNKLWRTVLHIMLFFSIFVLTLFIVYWIVNISRIDRKVLHSRSYRYLQQRAQQDASANHWRSDAGDFEIY